MADYVGDSVNGVVASPSIVAPDGSYGIFFLKDGTLKVVADPLSAAQIEALAFNTSGGVLAYGQPYVQNIRRRFTLAEINDGATLLAAKPGLKYRMVSCTAIAIGGAAAVSGVDVRDVQTGATAVIVNFGVAGLTQNTLVRVGDANTTILAGGLSFVAGDVNTPITVARDAGAMTTTTHIDINFSYTVEV